MGEKTVQGGSADERRAANSRVGIKVPVVDGLDQLLRDLDDLLLASCRDGNKDVTGREDTERTFEGRLCSWAPNKLPSPPLHRARRPAARFSQREHKHGELQMEYEPGWTGEDSGDDWTGGGATFVGAELNLKRKPRLLVAMAASDAARSCILER